MIRKYAELRERELIKLAALGSALAEALHQRGVAEPAASLVAEAGIAVFKIAFERWVDDVKRGKLRHHVHEAMDALKAVASGQVAMTGDNARAKTTPTPGARPSDARAKSAGRNPSARR